MALNGSAILVVMWMLLGLILGVVSSVLLDSSLIDLVSPVNCPPILWSSWNAMTTIEDEKGFFFFSFFLIVGNSWDLVPL